jgi:methionyl-tRNA formyltransferase
MKIVFFGSSDFGLPSLERLRAEGHAVVGVVTTPDRAKGRGRRVEPSPVAAYARGQGISPVLTPEELGDPGFARSLEALKADLFVVIAYRLLPKSVFGIPPVGTVNLHASLLPRYRGAAPIQRAIENGERQTGVTVFRIDAGVDTGGVLLQRQAEIGERETAPELSERLSRLGADAMAEAVRGLADGTLKARVQDDTVASRAPKLRKEEGRMDWALPARRLFDRVRAFKPFPGTYTFVDNRRLGIEWAEVTGESGSGEPGTVEDARERGIMVRCGEGCLLVTRVRPEGKPGMEAGAYLRGTPMRQGARLG